jgi:hypothetical protein
MAHGWLCGCCVRVLCVVGVDINVPAGVTTVANRYGSATSTAMTAIKVRRIADAEGDGMTHQQDRTG